MVIVTTWISLILFVASSFVINWFFCSNFRMGDHVVVEDHHDVAERSGSQDLNEHHDIANYNCDMVVV